MTLGQRHFFKENKPTKQPRVPCTDRVFLVKQEKIKFYYFSFIFIFIFISGGKVDGVFGRLPPKES